MCPYARDLVDTGPCVCMQVHGSHSRPVLARLATRDHEIPQFLLTFYNISSKAKVLRRVFIGSLREKTPSIEGKKGMKSAALK